MSDELISNIAAESPESASMRRLLQAKKEMLGNGVEACQDVIFGSKLIGTLLVMDSTDGIADHIYSGRR